MEEYQKQVEREVSEAFLIRKATGGYSFRIPDSSQLHNE
jgi:hypothetical protein